MFTEKLWETVFCGSKCGYLSGLEMYPCLATPSVLGRNVDLIAERSLVTEPFVVSHQESSEKPIVTTMTGRWQKSTLSSKPKSTAENCPVAVRNGYQARDGFVQDKIPIHVNCKDSFFLCMCSLRFYLEKLWCGFNFTRLGATQWPSRSGRGAEIWLPLLRTIFGNGGVWWSDFLKLHASLLEIEFLLNLGTCNPFKWHAERFQVQRLSLVLFKWTLDWGMIGFGYVPALSSPSPRAGSASDSFAGLWRIADPGKNIHHKASELCPWICSGSKWSPFKIGRHETVTML